MTEKEMPVFIKVDEYKEVLEILKAVKARLEDAKRVLYKIDQLKNKEDAELDTWRANIQEIERKVEDIDNSMFGPETF